MAESAVKTAKKLITTTAESNSDAWLAVLAQRNTPSEGMVTNLTKRLFCRQTKGLLPLAAKQVEHNTATVQADKINFKQRQEQSCDVHNRRAHNLPQLTEGDKVCVRPHRLGDKHWTPPDKSSN